MTWKKYIVYFVIAVAVVALITYDWRCNDKPPKIADTVTTVKADTAATYSQQRAYDAKLSSYRDSLAASREEIKQLKAYTVTLKKTANAARVELVAKIAAIKDTAAAKEVKTAALDYFKTEDNKTDNSDSLTQKYEAQLITKDSALQVQDDRYKALDASYSKCIADKSTVLKSSRKTEKKAWWNKAEKTIWKTGAIAAGVYILVNAVFK